MPKVTMVGPGIVRLCPHAGPHGMVHPTWNSRDGAMGVCMMDDHHIANSIRMLIKSMRAFENAYRPSYYDREEDIIPYWHFPEYQSTEEKLEMLCRERNRRVMVRKGTASDMHSLVKPGTAKEREGSRRHRKVSVNPSPPERGFWRMGNSDNMDLEWQPLGNSEIEVRTRLIEAEAQQMGLFPGFGEDDDLIYDDSADPNMSRAERDAVRRGQL